MPCALVCFHLVPDNCYEMEINYPGGNIKKFKNIDSFQECQLICLRNAKCRYFTYFSKDHTVKKVNQKTCYLKSELVEKVKVSEALSGPKRCNSTQGKPASNSKSSTKSNPAFPKDQSGKTLNITLALKVTKIFFLY